MNWWPLQAPCLPQAPGSQGSWSRPWRCCWCKQDHRAARCHGLCRQKSGSSGEPAVLAPARLPARLPPSSSSVDIASASIKCASCNRGKKNPKITNREAFALLTCIGGSQSKDAFFSQGPGQPPNEVYLIKRLVPAEFSSWKRAFICSTMKGAAHDSHFLSIRDTVTSRGRLPWQVHAGAVSPGVFHSGETSGAHALE